MRTFLAIAVLMVAALPAGAEECATVEFDWAKGPEAPKMIGTGTESIRLETVGTFLWYGTGSDLGEGLSSVEVPFGAVTATACAEGVTFTLPETAPTVEPVAPIFDVTPEEWAQFIEPLVYGIH